MKIKNILIPTLILFTSNSFAFNNCNPTEKELSLHKSENYGDYNFYYLNKDTDNNGYYHYKGNSFIVEQKERFTCYENLEYTIQYNEDKNKYIINNFILSSDNGYLEISHAEINPTFFKKISTNQIKPENILREIILNVTSATVFIRDNGGLTDNINNLTNLDIQEESYSKINIHKEGNYITVPRFFVGIKNNFAYDGNFQFEIGITENNEISIKNSHFNFLNIYGKDKIGFLGQIVKNLKNDKLLSIFNNTPFENMINGTNNIFDYKYKNVHVSKNDS